MSARFLLLVGFLALAASPRDAHAQASVCTMDLLGNEYDVFVIPRVGGLVVEMGAMNGVKIFESGTGPIPFATAVGRTSSIGVAVGYAPEAGLSFFDAPEGGTSAASDINLGDDIVGVYGAQASVPRAFLFTVEERFRYLDEVFPAVATIADDGSSRAWAINDDRQIIVTDAANTEGKAYLLQPGGSLAPIDASPQDCMVFGGGMLNDNGEVLPGGVRGGGGSGACIEVNVALNDNGTVVGYENVSEEETVAIRDGVPLPGGEGAQATDVNDRGYVAGYPGVVWTPEGDKADIGQAIKAQCNLGIFGPYLLADGTLPQNTYINDELWISTESLFMRPAVPDIVYGTSGTGFEFFDDGTPEGTGIGVRVGNPFTVTFTIQNIGRNALHNVAVTATEAPSMFELVDGPNPPLPFSIEPGATFQATSEFEAVGAGILSSITVVAGTDPSGVPFEFEQLPRRILFVGNGGLNAKIRAEPATVKIGEPLAVTLTATNVTGFELTDVAPDGPLVFAGEGDANVVDGPTPAAVASLPAGASAQFVYELEATTGGSMTIHATLGATTEQGDDVTADAKCSIGEEELLVAGDDAEAQAPAVCPIDGGAAVKIEECKLTLTSGGTFIRRAKLEGDSEPAADTGYPPGAT